MFPGRKSGSSRLKAEGDPKSVQEAGFLVVLDVVAVSKHGQPAMQLSTAADLSFECLRLHACTAMFYACPMIHGSLSVLMHEDRSIDCTEDEFMGFSVTSERSYQIHVLMFSSGFDERAISAQLRRLPLS